MRNTIACILGLLLAALPVLAAGQGTVPLVGLSAFALSPDAGYRDSGPARDAGAVGPGSAPAPAPAPAPARAPGPGWGPSQPDPVPMVTRDQYVFDLRFRSGEVFLVGVREEQLPEAAATARAFGRFALELYEGAALIERVRFDFPFLGAGVGIDDGGMFSPMKLHTRIGVFFPKTPRGTRLVLVDRASETSYPLAWPPAVSEQPRAMP
jgi:hypothetical protein